MPHRGSKSAAFLNGKAAYGAFVSGDTYRESALALHMLRGLKRLPAFTLVKVDARAEKCDKQDRGEGGCADPCGAAGNGSGER